MQKLSLERNENKIQPHTHTKLIITNIHYKLLH